MLTTIKNYEEFLIYYYNLCLVKPEIQGGAKFWELKYTKLHHDLITFPEWYKEGKFLVPEELVECFLIWWKEGNPVTEKLKLN